MPDEPVWPNRLLILAVCIGGGIGLGIALALAVEILFRPIRDPDSLAAVTGENPLAVVPVIEPRKVARRGVGLRRFLPFSTAS
jgi:capsular polysaccharide biosynthesis protein